ncbi:MAG TPA: NUDIX hydrolase [Candidatus Cybelea sp.]|nr:NUDIX hydrolase [Candidatus Cybelea sp.]
MTTIHLATGIAIRDGRLLLVASHYPNQPQPLWNLPGGRQQSGELLVETVVREFFEETQLHVHAGELAYVSESYDGERHFLNAAFHVSFDEQSFDEQSFDKLRMTPREHVVGVEWVALSEVRERIAVAVVREPLLAYLQGALERRYAGFHEAGITIEWPSGSA